jgi:hypothetical protein
VNNTFPNAIGRIIIKTGGERAKRSGLVIDSVIMTDHLVTLQYAEIDRGIGALSDPADLDAALRVTLAF